MGDGKLTLVSRIHAHLLDLWPQKSMKPPRAAGVAHCIRSNNLVRSVADVGTGILLRDDLVVREERAFEVRFEPRIDLIPLLRVDAQQALREVLQAQRALQRGHQIGLEHGVVVALGPRQAEVLQRDTDVVLAVVEDQRALPNRN